MSSPSPSPSGSPVSSPNQQKLGEYLCDRLYAAGVHDLFAVPGDFNLGLLNKFVDSKVRYVGCCNELNAAYASDGYARITGIGACLTTYAVGELSAMNGIAGAYAESVPVVKIVGAPARRFFKEMPLLHHTLGDYMTPMNMYSKICVETIMLDDELKAAKDIDRALKACLRLKRPVYLAVPADMVEVMIEKTEGEWAPCPPEKSDEAVLIEAVEEIAQRIAKAERPVFIPGVELIRRGLQSKFQELTEKCNIPYVTMMLSKGLLNEDHPNFMGLYAGARSRPEVSEALSNSDCVVIIGEKLTDFNTGGFSTGYDSRNRVMVNYSNVYVSSHSYSNIFIHDVLDRMIARIAETKGWAFPRASIGCVHRKNSSLGEEPDLSADMTMNEMFKSMAAWMPERSVVIAETGASMFSAAETMLPVGSTYIGQTFYGSIGYSVGSCLGACIGVKATDPTRRVVLFVGDGSFQLTCQEISTMIRYECNPVVFLINNDGYTIERVITDNTYNDIQMWKYCMLPEVFGGEKGTKCNTVGEFQEAIHRAKDNKGKMAFIEVILDRWDCNDLLKNAGRMMAINNNLKPAVIPQKGGK